MAAAITLKVETRDPAKNKGTGTRVARRLRARGRVPAIVYGHKQAPTPISLAKEDVQAMIKNASHLAQIDLGGTSEMVLVRDIQWDYLGKEILHLDFARVSADETVEAQVTLDVRGEVAGGNTEIVVHAVTVHCRPTSIPDSIRVDIGHLAIGEAIHVKDLTLPEGVEVKADPDLLLVHVVAPKTDTEEEGEAAAGAVQPEVIGRKADEDKKEE